MSTYREALLPVAGGALGVCMHGQQAEGPPRQAQDLSTDLHAASTQRMQDPQLRQHNVGQGPPQHEPFLREHKPPCGSLHPALESARGPPSNTPDPPPPPHPVPEPPGVVPSKLRNAPSGLWGGFPGLRCWEGH